MNFLERLKRDRTETVTFVTAVLVSVLSITDFIRYLSLGEPIGITTTLVLNGLFMLCVWGAHFGKIPTLNILVAGFSFWLIFYTVNPPTATFGIPFVIQSIVAFLGTILGTVFAVLDKVYPDKKIVSVFCAIIAVIPAIFGGIWAGNSIVSNGKEKAEREIWQVPDKFENKDNTQKGMVQKVDYQTKAYATDKRVVTKSAYVYLPYGYNEDTEYDILYLMHGTGDDEAYWLVTHEWNKTMLDNMIEQKVIRPVIVVTPTFYVENDCEGDLDQLTYSFKDELRNDLMPVIEAKYSTYAKTIDDNGFKESRKHRAFAGLSRGAVTTLHSVFCGSLDYFSSFGTFSGSRTTADYFDKTVGSSEFKDLSIDYWYVSTGNFDFAYAGQVQDYKEIVKNESRLTADVNTNFDVFPMRYHSQGNWHLALYNFLQKIY